MFINEGSAIFTRLAANSSIISELGGTVIFERFVPTGQTKPYVIFFESSGGDVNETPRDTRNLVVTVKAVSGSNLQAKRLAAYIRTSLHGAEESMSAGSGWEIYRSQLTVNIEYPVLIDTKQEYHAGGVYRIRLNAT